MNIQSLITLLKLFLLFVLLWNKNLSANTSTLDWIDLSDNVLNEWNVSYSDGELLSLEFFPKKLQPSQINKTIFVILPKKSNSYSLALNKFLETMKRDQIAAHISVFNFQKQTSLGLQILAKAKQADIDLIFSLGSETASLVSNHFKGESIPVITSINKDPVLLGFVDDYTSPSGSNIAYTTLNIPIDIQINYLKTLKPNLKAIGLIYNVQHQAVMQTEVRPIKEKFKEIGIEVIDIQVSSRETAKEELQRALPAAMQQLQDSDESLDNSLFWLTSSTAAFSEISTINQYSQNIPVIGSIPNIVKPGDDSAVLGIGIDRRNNALLASMYAVKVLKKEVNVSDLTVGIVSPPDIAINFKIARKIGLKIPFDFFESASFIYNYQGQPARTFGKDLQ